MCMRFVRAFDWLTAMLRCCWQNPMSDSRRCMKFQYQSSRPSSSGDEIITKIVVEQCTSNGHREDLRLDIEVPSKLVRDEQITIGDDRPWEGAFPTPEDQCMPIASGLADDRHAPWPEVGETGDDLRRSSVRCRWDPRTRDRGSGPRGYRSGVGLVAARVACHVAVVCPRLPPIVESSAETCASGGDQGARFWPAAALARWGGRQLQVTPR